MWSERLARLVMATSNDVQGGGVSKSDCLRAETTQRGYYGAYKLAQGGRGTDASQRAIDGSKSPAENGRRSVSAGSRSSSIDRVEQHLTVWL